MVNSESKRTRSRGDRCVGRPAAARPAAARSAAAERPAAGPAEPAPGIATAGGQPAPHAAAAGGQPALDADASGGQPAPSESSAEGDAHRLRRGLVATTALVLVALGIGFAIPDLREVLERIGGAAPGWLMLAVALEVLSCLGYVATLRLVLRRGPARDVRRLAWAEQAFGAVVPVGGAGSLAVGAWAMRAWGISWSRIANRSAVTFLLTSAINAGVLALAGFGVALGIGTHKSGVVHGLVPAGAAVAAIAVFALLPLVPSGRGGPRQLRALLGAARGLGRWVRDTESVFLQLDWRLLGAIGYLLFDIAALWVCLRAVGVSAPPLALIVAYQIGYLANIVPIPGAIGALEGGLLGALLLYGLPAAPTAAAVVLYHGVALVIPTLGGTIGFAQLRRSVSQRDSARSLSAVPGDRPAPAPAAEPASADLAA